MKRLLLLILSLFCLLLACTSKNETPFVDDQAKILTQPQIERIEQFHQLLLTEQDIHFFVSTLAKPTDDIDKKALHIFEQYGIGHKTTGARGLLLLIDPHQQQARIEVGYDLEGIFPDGFIAGLQYEQMLPFFQHDRTGHGIEALTELLVNQLLVQSAENDPTPIKQQYLSGGAGAKINTAKPDPAANFEQQHQETDFLPQATPLATLEQYRDSLALRIKNPNLAIYTPKSRKFFQSWLVTDAQQQNALQLLEKTLATAEIIEFGKLAVIRFPVANRQASPYYFERSSRGWQLDFATMSHTISFNHRNQWHFLSLDHPYMEAFKDYRYDQNGFPFTK